MADKTSKEPGQRLELPEHGKRAASAALGFLCAQGQFHLYFAGTAEVGQVLNPVDVPVRLPFILFQNPVDLAKYGYYGTLAQMLIGGIGFRAPEVDGGVFGVFLAFVFNFLGDDQLQV